MKLRTIGLALIASAFMTSTAFAQAGTMQPIPNPPEKAKPHKHHKHHAKPKAAATTEAAKPAEAKGKDAGKDTAAAKPAPATPPKK